MLKNSKYFDSSLSTFEKNVKWKKQIQKNIQNEHLLRERKEFEECLFKPKTFNFENNLVQLISNDYLYRKNTEWKNKIDSKRQKVMEDREIQWRKMSNKRFTSRNDLPFVRKQLYLKTNESNPIKILNQGGSERNSVL